MIRFLLRVVLTSLFTVWTDSHVGMRRGKVVFSILLHLFRANIQALLYKVRTEWEVMHCAVFMCKWTCCCRPESAEDNILNILDSPASESKPVLSASSNQRVISLSCSALSPLFWLNMFNVFPYTAFQRWQVSIRSWSDRHVPLPPHVSPSLSLRLHFCLTPAACCSYQDTELFEIIEKLQVSYSMIDLV